MSYKHYDAELIHYDEKQRFEQIERNIPEIRSFKTLLYIGARESGFQFRDILLCLGYEITVLEVFPPNIAALRREGAIVIQGDIREFRAEKKWDIVMWWHGPEHIRRNELAKTLNNIEALTQQMLILGCPWGIYEQGESYGNPYEIHHSHLYPENFIEFGFDVESLGIRDKPGSNLLAWKRME